MVKELEYKVEKLKYNGWTSCSRGSKPNPNVQLVNKPFWISSHEVLQLWLINTVYHLFVKNNKGSGLKRDVGLVNFLLLKLEGLIKKIYGTLIHVSFIIFISTHPVYPEVYNSESEVLWVPLSFLHLFTLVIAKNLKKIEFIVAYRAWEQASIKRLVMSWATVKMKEDVHINEKRCVHGSFWSISSKISPRLLKRDFALLLNYYPAT